MHKNQLSPIQRYQNCFHIQWLNGDIVSTIATVQKRNMYTFSTHPVHYQLPRLSTQIVTLEGPRYHFWVATFYNIPAWVSKKMEVCPLQHHIKYCSSFHRRNAMLARN